MAYPHGHQHYSGINIGDSSRAHLGNVYNYGESQDERAFHAILKSLSYPGMTDRQDALAEAHVGTFDWTFVEGDTEFTTNSHIFSTGTQYDSVHLVEMNFSSWLQRDFGGLFCVIGKPGAGKSTLMKSLASNRGVEERLKSWSKDKILIRAEHFFWIPGPSVQKTLEGFLRSVIYSTLCAFSCLDKSDCLAKMKNLCGLRWASMNDRSSWSRQELKLLLSDLTSIPNLRIFFLVDALDECCPQDAHWRLAEEILWLSRLPHVKLCVSFRPWDAFVRKFRSAPSLRLDSVTYHDMAKYVEERLTDAEEQCDLRHDFRTKTSSAKRLIYEVANNAKGVFLWIELVTNALCSELRRGNSSIQELYKIAAEFPPGLDDYFHELIFDRLGKTRSNVRDTAAALQLALKISHQSGICPEYLSPKSFMSFWLLSRGHLQRGFSRNGYHSIEQKSTKHMLKETVKFLEETCKDLLVPISVGREWHIDFFHRTAYDFLRDNYINLGLEKQAPAHFSEPDFLTEVNRLRCICIVQSERSCRIVSEIFYNILFEYLRQDPLDPCPQWLAVCENLVITQMRACCDCEGMPHITRGYMALQCVQAGLSKYLLEDMVDHPYLALLCVYRDLSLLDIFLQVPIQPGSRNMYVPNFEVLRLVLECGCDPNKSIGRWPNERQDDNTSTLQWCRRTSWEAWLGGMHLLSQQRGRTADRSKSALAGFPMQSHNTDALVDLLLRHGADPDCRPCITNHEMLPYEDNCSGPATCHLLTVKELLPAIVSPEALPRLTNLLAECSNGLAPSPRRYDQHRRVIRCFVFSEAKLERHIAVVKGQRLLDFQQPSFLATLMDFNRLDDATVCVSCSKAYSPARRGDGCLVTWCIDCCGISWLCHKCSEASVSGTHDLGHPPRGSGSYGEADISGHTSITVPRNAMYDDFDESEPMPYYSVARAVTTLKEWYARNPISLSWS